MRCTLPQTAVENVDGCESTSSSWGLETSPADALIGLDAIPGM